MCFRSLRLLVQDQGAQYENAVLLKSVKTWGTWKNQPLRVETGKDTELIWKLTYLLIHMHDDNTDLNLELRYHWLIH